MATEDIVRLRSALEGYRLYADTLYEVVDRIQNSKDGKVA